ncbi:MAG: hypothetical protein VXZ30_00275 [Planctomycetota bacterium]|nr:hypothetical protein [Planctomycetota bacterium]
MTVNAIYVFGHFQGGNKNILRVICRDLASKDLGERGKKINDGVMFFTWHATAWCIMSYSDERDDLTSNKMVVTWRTRTATEADAWEEFLESADTLMMAWAKRFVPDLADKNLLIEEWEYELSTIE